MSGTSWYFLAGVIVCLIAAVVLIRAIVLDDVLGNDSDAGLAGLICLVLFMAAISVPFWPFVLGFGVLYGLVRLVLHVVRQRSDLHVSRQFHGKEPS